MALFTPSLTNDILLAPRCFFRSRKSSISRKSDRSTLSLSNSVRLFPRSTVDSDTQPISRTQLVLAVEESESLDAGEMTEAPFVTTDSSPTPGQSKRSMSRVTKEDLVPGATFTGKVRSVQPYGAFVDFGAFTDGLVHVSRLSDSYVKDVASFVSVGQEVKVSLVEVNHETGRISLTMRESDDDRAPKTPNKSPRRDRRKRGEAKNTSENLTDDDGKSDSKLVRGGVVYTATNPFVLAFGENKDVSAVLEQRKDSEEAEENTKKAYAEA